LRSLSAAAGHIRLTNVGCNSPPKLGIATRNRSCPPAIPTQCAHHAHMACHAKRCGAKREVLGTTGTRDVLGTTYERRQLGTSRARSSLLVGWFSGVVILWTVELPPVPAYTDDNSGSAEHAQPNEETTHRIMQYCRGSRSFCVAIWRISSSLSAQGLACLLTIFTTVITIDPRMINPTPSPAYSCSSKRARYRAPDSGARHGFEGWGQPQSWSARTSDGTWLALGYWHSPSSPWQNCPDVIDGESPFAKVLHEHVWKGSCGICL